MRCGCIFSPSTTTRSFHGTVSGLRAFQVKKLISLPAGGAGSSSSSAEAGPPEAPTIQIFKQTNEGLETIVKYLQELQLFASIPPPTI